MGSAIAFLIAQGWASGISVWGVIVTTGIADRAGWVEAPGYLGSTPLLIVASVLLLIEFFADKIPFLDSASDTVQTLVRPTVGAAIAAQYGGAEEELSSEIAALLGGGSATVSHLVKAGLRAAINVSPEPVSNVVVSSTEDVLAVTVLLLAFSHPWVSLIVALSLLALMAVLAIVAVFVARSAYRRMRRTEPENVPDVQYGRFRRWIAGDP